MKRVLAAAVLLFVGLSLIAPTAASGAEPSGFEYFHTYAEAADAIDAAVADHPNLARKFSIGQSYHGRSIWAIKLTADIGAGNHDRPEVVIQAAMHGRERAAAELALYMIDVLTDKYGDTSTTVGRRVTAILDTTVIHIVPMLNPD